MGVVNKIIYTMFIFMLLFIYLTYDKPPEPPSPSSSTVSSSTHTPQIIVMNRTYWTNKTNIINITVYDNVTVINQKNITAYYTLNLTAFQQQQLMNLKPDRCFTTGCSDGFDKAKREMLSILELKGPKFRETFGTGYDPFFKVNDSQAVFNIYSDAVGDYLNLNGSYWYLTIPGQYQYINESMLNQTLYLNITYRVDRNNIKIRRI